MSITPSSPPPRASNVTTFSPHRSYVNRRIRSGTFRHAVKRVSLASKRKIWDTNDASIAVTQTALSQWEKTYTTLRSLVIHTTTSAKSAYSTAKSGAHSIEHHLLVPVRDTLILPAFSTAERVASSAVDFVSSDEAKHLASTGFHVVKQTPLVGESILAPAILTSTDILKQAWHIAQYPIPPRKSVVDVTDRVMTTMKVTLTNTWRECFIYAQLLDANITRTLMHTQWRILGSGPYVTLDDVSKQELIHHLCERYMSYSDRIARYEFAKHIQNQNSNLYNDLVVNGVLYKRGGDFIKHDEWLLPLPSYREKERVFFLTLGTSECIREEDISVKPMWFYMPGTKGKHQKDVPWIPFDEVDQHNLEKGFVTWYETNIHDVSNHQNTEHTDSKSFIKHFQMEPTLNNEHEKKASNIYIPSEKQSTIDVEEEQTTSSENFHHQKYPTIANWYNPSKQDILVDQFRYAVTFTPNCSICGGSIVPSTENNNGSAPENSLNAFHCRCVKLRTTCMPVVQILKHPTLWRFHGSGDKVRRGTWLLHTNRNGLQPYSDASAAILEDAYLFLKHEILTKNKSYPKVKDHDDDVDDIGNILLTVQVVGPDGEENQLVQFSSLNKITAVQKTLGAAVSIFKRRVYRGACWGKDYDDGKCNIKENDFRTSHNDQTNAESMKDTNIANMSDTDDCENRNDDIRQVQHSVSEERNNQPCRSSKDKLVAVPYNIVKNNQRDNKNRELDNNIDHLVLVVHGIGEMLQNIDFFGLAQISSLIECCAQLRENHSMVLEAQHSHEDDRDRAFKRNYYGRVEYIPVEWHEAFAIRSRRRQRPSNFPSTVTETNKRNSLSINDLSPQYVNRGVPSSTPANVHDISLKTIPRLRSFANDTLLDVLYFMSPEHHDLLIDIVTNEMNDVVERFRSLTGYSGKISIMAHSLGSIITWDILSHQRPKINPSSDASFQSPTSTLPDISAPLTSAYPQLSFPVTNTFILGSPVAVFLLIRNKNQPLPSNYSLPGCKRIFNIFHPYDPAAYRIEPLIDNRNATIDAKLITHWKGGFRVQYQTKILWQKLLNKTFETKQNMLEAVEAGMTEIGLLDATVDDFLEDEGEDEFLELDWDEASTQEASQCGQLNQGRRIDYMLQEKEIENANEYVFALGAHSAYWDEKDLSLFVAREILRSKREDDEIYDSHDYEDMNTPIQIFM